MRLFSHRRVVETHLKTMGALFFCEPITHKNAVMQVFPVFPPAQTSTVKIQQALSAGLFSKTSWQLTSDTRYHMVGGFFGFYRLWPPYL